MKVYLDDNLADKSLEAMLIKGGHAVVRSAAAGLLGASDPRHLAYAIRAGLVMLTSDWEDFEDLHHLILAAAGTHPGILTVRYESDPTRNMRPHHIVKALGKLERSGAILRNDLIVLNHWR
jgi:predicted nuclease of predicted toxin-antitoxin system